MRTVSDASPGALGPRDPTVLAPGSALDESGTAPARLAIAGLSLASLAVGLVAATLDAPVVRTVGLVFYCLVGLGAAPWGLHPRMRLPVRLAVTGLTSLSALTLIATAMLLAGFWRPYLTFGAVVALTVPLHGLAVRRALRDQRGPRGLRGLGLARSEPGHAGIGRHRRPSGISAPTGALLGGLLCLFAVLTHRYIEPGLWGFLAAIGPVWYVGLGLVVLAVVMALRAPSPEWSVALCVVVLLLVVTLTPALVYDGPRAQSAAKHVHLVQQIREQHRIDSTVEVYNAWPGFFAGMAWLSDVCGIRDPMGLAAGWPALLGLYRLTALRFLADRLAGPPALAWTAVVLAILADPIGADYFSPQSVGFVVGLFIVGIALSSIDPRLRWPLLATGGCALAMSHQLSPYIVGGVLVLLTAFRLVRPWWVPALVVGPTLIWTALHWATVAPILSLGDVGSAENFRPPKTMAAEGLDRLPVVPLTVAALVAGVLMLGLLALVALVRSRHDRMTWALASCPAVGLLLVAITPYGHEGIFRATLFGIPWLAVLAARSFRGHLDPTGRRPPFALVAALTATFLVASFGLDGSNVLRRSDLQAFRQFQHQALADPTHRHVLLNLGAGDLPSSPPTHDLRFMSVSREVIGVPVRPEAPGALDRVASDITERFVRYTGEAGGPRLYAIWSPTSSYYGWEYGLQRPDQFAELREAFRAAPYWHVVYESAGTVLFAFDPDTYVRGDG